MKARCRLNQPEVPSKVRVLRARPESRDPTDDGVAKQEGQHMSSRRSAPQSSPCGANTIDTGNDRSRKQMNITCSWKKKGEREIYHHSPGTAGPTTCWCGRRHWFGSLSSNRTGADKKERPSDTIKNMCSRS